MRIDRSSGRTAALILMLSIQPCLAQDPSASPSAEASPAATGGTSVRTLGQGPEAGEMLEKSIVVVTSAADFEALWKKIHASVEPVPPVPAIDWATAQVVAAFAGQKPSGGHDVQMRRLVAGAEGTVVEFADVPPPEDAMTTMMMSSPYLLLQVPAGRPVKATWQE